MQMGAGWYAAPKICAVCSLFCPVYVVLLQANIVTPMPSNVFQRSGVLSMDEAPVVGNRNAQHGSAEGSSQPTTSIDLKPSVTGEPGSSASSALGNVGTDAIHSEDTLPKAIPKPRAETSTSSPLTPSSELSVVIYAAVSPVTRRQPMSGQATGASDDSSRYLDIFYRGDALDGDWIGVFNADPVSESTAGASETSADHVLAKILVPNKDGPSIRVKEQCVTSLPNSQVHLLETSVLVPTVDIGQLPWPPKNKCLGLWVAYFRRETPDSNQNVPAAVNCLKIQPEWMRSMSDLLTTMTLADLFIPGSINSGINQRLSSSTEASQDESTLSQLIHGIRYLEFHVGFSTNVKDSLYVADENGKYVAPLLPQILELKEFLNKTEEVIFVNLKTFYEFRGHAGSHDALLKACSTHLGAWMAPRTFGPQSTMSLLWATNKRLIFMCADAETRSKNDFLWDPPKTINELLQSPSLTQSADKLDESSAHLAVPTTLSIYRAETASFSDNTEVQEGIMQRKAVRSTNSCLMSQLQAESRSAALGMNLVALEFFQSSFLVDLAIQMNFNKAKMRQSSESYAVRLEKEVIPREKNFTSGIKINLWHSSLIDEQHLKPILIGPRKVDAGNIQE